MTGERSDFPHRLDIVTVSSGGWTIFRCRCGERCDSSSYSRASDAFTAHLLDAYDGPAPPSH